MNRENLKISTMMKIARLLSSLSTCLRGQNGCVITDPKFKILGTGYNGAPDGQFHCSQVGCLEIGDSGCLRSIHAEVNAILDASKKRVKLDECMVFVTSSPCVRCTTALLQVGVREIFFIEEYKTQPIEIIQKLLLDANVELIKWKEEADDFV